MAPHLGTLLVVPLQWLKHALLAMAGHGLELPLGIELTLFAGVVLFMLIFQRALRRERQLARTDPLTGLANLRSFCEVATREFSRAQRFLRPVTIAYVDLDDFKGVNDQWGHAAGDTLLKMVARCLQRSVRPMDCVARLGGDEFAILLPETSPFGAKRALGHVFDALSRTFEETRRASTCSVGAVSFLNAPPSVESALRHVDSLMYQVKKNGKNGLCIGVWRNATTGTTQKSFRPLSSLKALEIGRL